MDPGWVLAHGNVGKEGHGVVNVACATTFDVIAPVVTDYYDCEVGGWSGDSGDGGGGSVDG